MYLVTYVFELQKILHDHNSQMNLIIFYLCF